jgi:hypothetical protein
VRGRLEPRGVLVARNVLLEERDHYATELARWDQRFPEPTSGGAAELATAALRAAVVAPEAEARRWFTWPVPQEDVDRLVQEGRLGRAGGLLHVV